MSVKRKIDERLNELEVGLRTGRHLAGDEGQSELEALLNSVYKFFTVMNDSERDFINSARIAIDERMPWI